MPNPTKGLVSDAIDLAEEFYASGDKDKVEEADKIMDAVAKALEAEFIMMQSEAMRRSQRPRFL